MPNTTKSNFIHKKLYKLIPARKPLHKIDHITIKSGRKHNKKATFSDSGYLRITSAHSPPQHNIVAKKRKSPAAARARPKGEKPNTHRPKSDPSPLTHIYLFIFICTQINAYMRSRVKTAGCSLNGQFIILSGFRRWNGSVFARDSENIGWMEFFSEPRVVT